MKVMDFLSLFLALLNLASSQNMRLTADTKGKPGVVEEPMHSNTADSTVSTAPWRKIKTVVKLIALLQAMCSIKCNYNTQMKPPFRLQLLIHIQKWHSTESSSKRDLPPVVTNMLHLLTWIGEISSV